MEYTVRLLLLLSAALVSTSQAFWFSRSRTPEPEWNGLKAGFGFNPFTSFNKLPRTETEALSAGWSRDTSVGCNVSGTAFNGNRYLKDDNHATMVLFDKNGYIAGLQAGIPKTKVYPRPQNAKYHVFIEEKDHWVITAYFTDPEKICTTGRSESQVIREGTGTMLAIQNGSSAASVMTAPMEEDRVIAETTFIQGKCFYGMGMHYWYDLTHTSSCDDTFPVFLMYNRGRLNAFGWAFNPNYVDSSTWEHPTASVFGSFIKDPPSCLGADGPVTTLHVYMTDSPTRNFC